MSPDSTAGLGERLSLVFNFTSRNSKLSLVDRVFAAEYEICVSPCTDIGDGSIS